VLRGLILIVSAAVAAIGVAYSEARGLILDVLPSGERIYSSALQSSGGDDAFLVRVAFWSFSVSAGTALLAGRARGATRALRGVYLANVVVLLFVLWLVNLDVSVLHSIRSGDHLLLAGLLLAACPLPFLWRSPRRGPLDATPSAP
jgi:hypothetical protein